MAAPASAEDLQVQLVEDTSDRVVVDYEIKDFELVPVTVSGAPYFDIELGSESRLKHTVGAPELPSVDRSVAIAGDARVEAHVIAADYREFLDIDIAPSKGILSRAIDPTDIAHQLGPVYQQDAFYPGDLVALGQPFIMRDVRGVVVTLFPFQYNPRSRTLRVYDRVTVELVRVGAALVNPLPIAARRPSRAFTGIYKNHFLNGISASKDRTRSVEGELLIIAHDAWLTNVAPLATHKNAIGIPTTVVGVGTIGNSATAITSYIESAFAGGNLAFVLLVGDSTQVASPSVGGSTSDPSYSKLAGNDDYPDILVGRFSAQSAGDVDTQVARTIDYETSPATTQPWFKKGVGIASTEGPGDDNELDYEHIGNIRTDLLAYGYTEVDEIYEPSATASQISSALNQGRGIINYCGHGYLEGWGTTNFSVSNVNALTNAGKLPFIVSVACNVGEFQSGTCFAESWLRATNGTSATGAIAFYGSSISQAWNPPMCAQDAITDLLASEAEFTLGGLLFAGASHMMDEYGSAGVTEFNAWHLFGDPSLRIFGVPTPPSGLTVEGDDLVASGDAGGPFTPASMTYTLENRGDSPIDYSVTSGQSWLDISAPTGTIAGNATVTVTVALGAGAAALGNGLYEDTVSFVNTTDHEGDTSRSAVIDIGIPSLQYQWTLDSDPGWTTQGAWQFGTPAGAGGEHGNRDPSSAHTGTNVYGYDLAGDYANGMGEQHLTTTAIDCSYLSKVTLRFQRWLGVETNEFDHAYIKVSADGESWTTVWENPASELADSSWTAQEFDISAIADGQATVYVRWTMGTTDDGWSYCGWNVDDVEIWGMGSLECQDGDGDGFTDHECGGDDCDDGVYAIRPNADEVCDDNIDNDCDGFTDDQDSDCGGDGGDDDDDDDDGDDPAGADEPWIVRGSCAVTTRDSRAGWPLVALFAIIALGRRRRRRRSRTNPN